MRVDGNYEPKKKTMKEQKNKKDNLDLINR